MGYSLAGFDVVGVDLSPQKRYPFTFVQADALEYLADHSAEFDAIHASPPCRDHTRLTGRWGKDGTGDLLPRTRAALEDTGLPYVIENVTGADMRRDLRLCGCMFDLPGLRRERWFETSVPGIYQPDHRPHVGRTVTVTGHTGGRSTRDGDAGFGSKADWERAMGIDWMTVPELSQAIPPAYTRYVGDHLIDIYFAGKQGV